MRSENFKLFRLARPEHRFFLILAACYVFALLIFVFIGSDYAIRFTGRTFFEPVGMGDFPLLLPGIMLVLFWLIAKKDFNHSKKIRQYPRIRMGIGFLATISAVALGLYVTHPPDALAGWMESVIGRSPHIGLPFIAGLLFGVMILPLIPVLVAVMPSSVLRRHKFTLAFGVLLYFIYLFSEVLNAYYFGMTGPWIVWSVQSLLGLLPGGVDPVVSRWEIAYRGFNVTLGSACTGLSSMLLFLGLLGFGWLRLSPVRAYRTLFLLLAAAVGLVLLWILNIIRIFSLVVVGSKWPDFAIGMFHGAAGSTIFLIFFLYYIRFVLRWFAADTGKPVPHHSSSRSLR